jgi:RNA-directed DNA polymerase
MAEEISNRVCFIGVRAPMTVRIMNLVAPLSHEDTAMHTTDTAAPSVGRSGAVSPLNARRGDIDSANKRRSTRTSTTATRTTTTSRRRAACAPSADSSNYSLELLLRAYQDCRKHKRNTQSALAFEQDLERNLWSLHQEIIDGSYTPGRSICFVITRPKPREVWAADFRDRIVHHLLYNHAAPKFYARFIADSCACIPGRGTLYAAKRLEGKVRSITQNWSRPAYYLKLDLENFFLRINKPILRDLLARHIADPWWMNLAETVVFHDPRQNFELRGDPRQLEKVPPYKRLTSQPSHLGLPIGNLSSQFFANVYLDVLDQFIKHGLRCKHYIRYVDDFVLLHESPQWLNEAKAAIEALLQDKLAARINPSKTILQPVDRGIDFVGQVIKPWRRVARKRTLNDALSRVSTIPADELYETANSYFGLLRQSKSHHSRTRLANVLRHRGHCINGAITKTYRRGKA